MASVTGVKVNLLKEVGELSEKKLKTVFELVKGSHPNITKLPFGHVFINPENKEIILLTPGQITVGFDGVDIKPDFLKLKSLTETIFEALLLDNKTGSVINFTALFPSEGSSMESSLAFLGSDKQFEISRIPEIIGVGLRFIYYSDELQGDFKVEPFLHDPTKFYMELSLPTKIKTVEEIFALTQTIFSDFTGKLAEFAKVIAGK